MKISVAESRISSRWTNGTTTWSKFTGKLSATTRTSETEDEYRQMSKPEQGRVKDVGGFVAGHLAHGKRKNGNVLSRSMLTLDVDQPDQDFWTVFTIMYDCRACMYSTHSHTPDHPRLRLIIPLSRDVSEEEYPAVGRKIAETLGIEQFDPTTYQAARLMYWPSTPRDGQYVYEQQDGEPLDPDSVLAQYDDWHDITTWPRANGEDTPRRSKSRMEDPTSKPGIVGAFCRAHTISSAINTYLTGVYEPTAMDDRYTYTAGESTGGLVTYEDTYAYSHHATDPVCGKEVNAFDLVRIHLYGKLDNDAKPDTPVNRLPSYTEMNTLAVEDDLVKKQLTEDRLKEAGEEFSNITDWTEKLELSPKTGRPLDTLENYVTILENDEQLHGIALNEMTNVITPLERLPWKQIMPTWSDNDESQLRAYVQKLYSLYSPNKLHDALVKVATDHAYHPVRQYIANLPTWDNVCRLDTLLVDYLGAEDNVYTRMVTRKTFTAAIARVLQPGIKFDNVLILNGPQGIGKSLLFSIMGVDWFSDSLTISDMRDKTAAEKTGDAWILELGELAGMRKMDAETIKSFLTRTHDKYRPAYGRNVETHPRQCVIVGTTNNEDGFLRDVTGNRRFWPVIVTGDTIAHPWDITPELRDMLWAEAAYRFSVDNEELFLTGEAEKMAEKAQASSMETDDREGMVRNYLDRLLPDRWDEMALWERQKYLNNELPENGEGIHRRQLVSNIEIWSECLGRNPSDFNIGEAYRIASIMSRIDGWEKGEASDRPRLPLYGRQRVYKRSEK